MKKVLVLMVCLAGWVSGEPTPAPRPALPVIEVNSSPTLQATKSSSSSNSTIELPAIEGQKPEKLQGKGLRYWGSPYGMPAGPGRGWPDAGPPGASGPAGGLLTPGGFPGRTY